MSTPGLTIETSAGGVDRLIIHLDRDDSASGFELLRRVLPTLRDLDRRSRALDQSTGKPQRPARKTRTVTA